MGAPTVGNTGTVSGNSGTLNWTVTQGDGVAIVSMQVRANQYSEVMGTYGGLSVLTAVDGTNASTVDVAAKIGYVVDFTGKSGDGRSAYSAYGDERDFRDFMLEHDLDRDILLVDAGKASKTGTADENVPLTLTNGAYHSICVSLGGSNPGSANWQAGIATATGKTFTSLWREDAGGRSLDAGYTTLGPGESITINRTLYEEGWHVAAIFGVPQFDLDALISSVETGSFEADAFVQPYFRAGAWIAGEGGYFGVDAFVQPYFDVDAILGQTVEPSFVAWALLNKVVTGSFGVDAIVLATMESGPGAPTIYAYSGWQHFDVDPTFSVGTSTIDDAYKASVAAYYRHEKYADMNYVRYGGLTSGNLSYVPVLADDGDQVLVGWYYKLGLTGRSGTNFTTDANFGNNNNGFGAIIEHPGIAIEEVDKQSSFIGDSAAGSYDHEFTVDPDGKDCILLVGAIKEDHLSGSISQAALSPSGKTFTQYGSSTNDSVKYEWGAYEVLAEDGPQTLTVTITVGTTQAQYVNMLLLGVPTDALVLDAVISPVFTVDAWIEGSGGYFGVDAFVQPWFALDARFVNPPITGDFTLDAIILATRTHLGGEMGYSHLYGTDTTYSWTHTAPTDAQAIVVTTRNDIATAVSYGNKALTYRGHGIWTLDDLSGRDDDVVRTTGLSGTVYHTSTIITNPREVEYVEYDIGPSGDFTIGDHTLTYDDTIPDDAWRAVVIHAYGGKDDPATYATAYQGDPTGYWLSSGRPSTNPITGYSGAAALNIQGPDSTSSVAGFTVSGGTSTLFQQAGVLFQARGQNSALADAYIVPLRGFVDAVVIGPVEQSMAVDAFITNATLDATILREQRGIIHWDSMSTTEVDTWGDPDIGLAYSYPDGGESLYDKASGVGTYYDDPAVSNHAVYANDDDYFGLTDKEVWFKAAMGLPSSAGFHYRFGLNGRVYLKWEMPNSLGQNMYLRLVVDGYEVGDAIGHQKTSDWMRIKARLEGTVLKFKWWQPASESEPDDWQETYDASGMGYAATVGSTYWKSHSVDWFGTGNGGPWTQQFDDWKVFLPGEYAFSVDAEIVLVTVDSSFGVDARINYWTAVNAFVQPYFFVDAETYYAYLRYGRPAFVRAYIVGPSFTVDAFVQPLLTVDAVISERYLTVDAVLAGEATPSFAVDAEIGGWLFQVWAIIGTKVTWDDFFVVRAEIDDTPITKVFEGHDGWPIDAHIDGADGAMTLDAAITDGVHTSSFAIDASFGAVGEERGQLLLDATLAIVGDGRFLAGAVVTQNAPLRLDGWISGIITLDAVLGHLAGSGSLTADAWLTGTPTGQLNVSAVVADASGGYRGEHLDAVILGTQADPRLHFFEVLARIVGSPESSFGVDAVLSSSFTVDARIWQPIFVDAFIETDQVIVYPPSQSGEDGTSTDGTTFTSPGASFDPDMVGDTIIIDGSEYTIVSVIDENTITVSPTDVPFGEGDLVWSIPSGDPTDPVGDPPLTARISQVLIEWSRPDKEQWSDLTGDVMWESASFTQTARVGPGTFEMTLKGDFSQFIGGEEIRVTIDGYRVFGGYVTEIERGYAFEAHHEEPLTFLKGTDYNALLDRLLIYNAAWDNKRESGPGPRPYRTWQPFPKGTLDREIITTVGRRYMTDPALMGLDMSTYVDEIETPAPTTGFQMESGMSLRNLLTEISRITEGVWFIDAFKNLHYHSREVITAPYPITDGDGGIACRGLRISSNLEVVTNDVFAWGTAAFLDTGDSDIIYSRQTADQDWDVDWWQAKIDYTEEQIAKIRETPYDQRTLKQRARLEAKRKQLVVYDRYLARAQASSEAGSIERYGRWQTAEFRQDIYQQSKLDRRARAIMDRYSEPVVKAQATVFDPGFGAGQMAEVVSVRHGVADELPIRQMTLDFVVAKEPVGGTYYAVPRYALALGLDPEEPWNIYQFLPYPDLPDWNVHFNIPTILIDLDGQDIGFSPGFLDTFERIWWDLEDLGEATNERDEDRWWTP